MLDNSDFWYPWKPVKFRAATMHLSDEQELIYRRLLDYYMETGKPLPDSMIALSKIAHVSIEKITDAWSMLSSFFQSHDGKLFQDECEENLSEQAAKSKKRVKKAKNAADSRWKNKIKSKNATSNTQSNAKDMQQAMLGDATGQDRTIEGITKEVTPSKRVSEKTPKDYTPEFLQFWQAYPKNNGSKQDAFKAFNNAIRKGTTHETIIEGAGRFAKFCEHKGTEQQYIPHASTWVNGKRWESDYTITIPGTNGKGQPGNNSYSEGKAGAARRAVQQGLAEMGYFPERERRTNGANSGGNGADLFRVSENLQQDPRTISADYAHVPDNFGGLPRESNRSGVQGMDESQRGISHAVGHHKNFTS